MLDEGDLGLGQGRQLRPGCARVGSPGLSRGAPLVQAATGQLPASVGRERVELACKAKGLPLEQFPAFQLQLTPGDPLPEEPLLGLLDRQDEVPDVAIFHRHARQDLVGRGPPVMATLVDEHQPRHVSSRAGPVNRSRPDQLRGSYPCAWAPSSARGRQSLAPVSLLPTPVPTRRSMGGMGSERCPGSSA